MAAAGVGCLLLAAWDVRWLWPLVLIVPALAVGVWDVVQPEHAVLRNHPIVGHFRYLIEDLGPELHQYFVESNTDGEPFDRDQRSKAYQRAKGALDEKPFGTEIDVYGEGYVWLSHSIRAKEPQREAAKELRVRIGGERCTAPYSASLLNVSAMSFGSLGAAAVRTLNEGARLGGFAHDTGEGGISVHHREPGGDLIWQIGSGYFGCRRADGGFDADRFAEQARGAQVKMVEVKLSQGAKPGHGGILPGRKVTSEIAAARGVPVGTTCISPPAHGAFTTPVGLLEFLEQLRELAGGKPVGFKLCVGSPVEYLGIVKAMHETGLVPDFVVIDGGEGGTGAGPIELTDHGGMPLREGLTFAHRALVGAGVRDRIKLGASAKLLTGFDIAIALALGADWANNARGFMFALGCIQAQRCHTNQCPVGITTHDRWLQRGLVVGEKAERVRRFHHETVDALAQIAAAAGLASAHDFRPELFYQRFGPADVRPLDAVYPPIEPEALLEGRAPETLQTLWAQADARSFG
ncbi:MAG: FMN-binding glutamate synthase family protein [Myxococcota bacterium]